MKSIVCTDTKRLSWLWIALLVMLLAAAPVQTAMAGALTVQDQASADGIEFKIDYNEGRYTVIMRPSATPAVPNMTLSVQVTIRVPHGEGADRFEVAALQSLVGGTAWTASSRVDAPQEAPDMDYISFTVEYTGGDLSVFNWMADQEMAVFSFENSGNDLGAVDLMLNCDDFMSPNSASTNPGNYIAVLILGDGNAYLGNYDVPSNYCGAGGADTLYLPIVSK